jgi:hypothetical protein
MNAPPEVIELLTIHRAIEKVVESLGYKVSGVSRTRDKDGKLLKLEVSLVPLKKGVGQGQ